MKPAAHPAPPQDDFVHMMFFQTKEAGRRSAPAADPKARAVPAATYRPLRQSRLRPEAGCHLPAAGGRQVTAGSPAIEVMTDFRSVAPLTTSPAATVDAANRNMISRGVRTLFVVDDARRILGIVTSTDVLGEKPMLVTQQRGLHHSEVLVGDIMTPVADLEGIDIADVNQARVGDIVATLVHAGRQHALVLEHFDGPDGAREMVRGMFSLSQCARQLEPEGAAAPGVQASASARSFAAISQSIA
jgi:CBS domain-containing protein